MDACSSSSDVSNSTTDAPDSWKFLKAVPPAFVLVVLSWSYYAYVCLCSGHVAPFCLYVYHAMVVLFLWSFFKVSLTEPIGAPSNFRLSDELFEEYIRCFWDVDRHDAILRNFADDLPIRTCHFLTGEIRFCDECRSVKPDRSHHCSVCRKCILKMDHHCSWINNCVSYSNYKYYLLFLTCGLSMCVLVASTTAEFVFRSWDENSDCQEYGASILFFAATIFSFFFSRLFVYHIYLVSINQTSFEARHPPRFLDGDDGGFNLGCCRNVQEAFGKEVNRPTGYTKLFP